MIFLLSIGCLGLLSTAHKIKNGHLLSTALTIFAKECGVVSICILFALILFILVGFVFFWMVGKGLDLVNKGQPVNVALTVEDFVDAFSSWIKKVAVNCPPISGRTLALLKYLIKTLVLSPLALKREIQKIRELKQEKKLLPLPEGREEMRHDK